MHAALYSGAKLLSELVAMQDCLEQVVVMGCVNLGLGDSAPSAEHAEQQQALFFDLKLVLGPGSSCLCHKCAPTSMTPVTSAVQCSFCRRLSGQHFFVSFVQLN